MKILIVSAYFPPQNAVASLRPYSWAKYWSRMGHDVTVLTTKKRQEKNNTTFDCSTFNVIETELKIPFRKVNADVKNVANNSGNNSKVKTSFKIKILSLLKKIYIHFIETTGCFSTIRFPDWHDGWIKEAIKVLPSIDYDLLVTTAGPYSVHRAGLYLKKKGWNGKWICDWRDLFTKNHMYHGLFIFWAYENWLEKKIHLNANVITTVSDGLTNILRKNTKIPVKTIYNGFDKEDFVLLLSKPRKKNKQLIISYLGTVYKNFRDPEALFKSIGELNKDGLITPSDLYIQFAGNNTADVSYLARKYNVEKYFTYLGFLPREKSLEIQYNSDLVLFLEYDNPKVKGILTGKLFEYLYISKKIIAIGCSNKCSAGSLIERCNAGICLGNDISKIKEYILNEVKNKKDNFDEHELNKDMNEINKYSRKLQAEKMLDLVK